MDRSDFDFDLPPELIAQAPLAERSASRMLWLDPVSGAIEDRVFLDLPGFCQPGDLLVFNNTKVLPARLHGHKPSGGAVEIMIERVCGTHEVIAQMRVSKKPKPGGVIVLADGSHATMLGREGDFFRLQFDTALDDLLPRIGTMPLPPYITRQADSSDDSRYQTVFAREPGAVAAPTAGLHFDQSMLDRLTAMGVQTGYVTLHVGAGTFQPVREGRLEDHVMHREYLEVGADLVEQIATTRARGNRVIAVGTTVVRALETATVEGRMRPYAGETQIFIYPGYPITSIDGLITNFHLPQSTLLMLISALAGRDHVLHAYRHAVLSGYRFFSYGDAMLILAGTDSRPPG
ncbi:tRNA preQ1(34) S-adenosylmethionine ribosyltransferase-isomerase QueA [Frateuria aurantia]